MNNNNSQSVSSRLALEAFTGATAALAIAPIVTIIDKAITTNASGVEPFKPAVINGVKTLLTKPRVFFTSPAFLWIWAVFSSTYAAANSIDALCEINDVEVFYPKFLGSSVVNVTMSVSKDRAYARMFGKGTPRPISWKSLGLFGVRDGMTILSSFCLPPIISAKLQEEMGMKKATADVTAQLTAPLGVQLLSTPLHLLGLDLYNRPTATAEQRISFISQEYGKTVLARFSRILPAFGIGGIVNTRLRAFLKSLPSEVDLRSKTPMHT